MVLKSIYLLSLITFKKWFQVSDMRTTSKNKFWRRKRTTHTESSNESIDWLKTFRLLKNTGSKIVIIRSRINSMLVKKAKFYSKFILILAGVSVLSQSGVVTTTSGCPPIQGSKRLFCKWCFTSFLSFYPKRLKWFKTTAKLWTNMALEQAEPAIFQATRWCTKTWRKSWQCCTRRRLHWSSPAATSQTTQLFLL